MNGEKFIITADRRMSEKELDREVFNFPIAMFSFFKSMADVETWERQASRFNPVRINHPKSDDSRSHWGKVLQWPMSIWNIEPGGMPIVFVGPVLSGPWVAMALEELKVLGLKYVIGIGAYGSFSKKLQIGDIVLADRAVVSDGTSKEYSTGLYSGPASGLLEMARRFFRQSDIDAKTSCVWTLDAMYRESVEKMREWAKTGAECVNMETGTFYTVAAELGIEAVYWGFVLDLIHTEEWTGWGGLDDELKNKADHTTSNLEIMENLAVQLARRIKNEYDGSGSI